MMFFRMLPIALVAGALLFTSAGRLVPAFVVYVVSIWLMFGGIYTVALRRSPDLVQERLRPPSDRDKASRRMAFPLIVAHYVLAGLDARFGWSAVPLPVQIVGLILILSGLSFAGWTILSNPYASTAVRLQPERNQTVITSGPYAIVRHPMYLGVLLFTLGGGPALGSWFAGLVLLPIIPIFVRRTLMEDRMLHDELEGYSAYATRVRWRVVPGLF